MNKRGAGSLITKLYTPAERKAEGLMNLGQNSVEKVVG